MRAYFNPPGREDYGLGGHPQASVSRDLEPPGSPEELVPSEPFEGGRVGRIKAYVTVQKLRDTGHDVRVYWKGVSAGPGIQRARRWQQPARTLSRRTAQIEYYPPLSVASYARNHRNGLGPELAHACHRSPDVYDLFTAPLPFLNYLYRFQYTPPPRSRYESLALCPVGI